MIHILKTAGPEYRACRSAHEKLTKIEIALLFRDSGIFSTAEELYDLYSEPMSFIDHGDTHFDKLSSLDRLEESVIYGWEDGSYACDFLRTGNDNKPKWLVEYWENKDDIMPVARGKNANKDIARIEALMQLNGREIWK